jgi:photosystem II S4 domain protein
MLPREDLLRGSRLSEALAPLIELAEQALRTWEPVWSGFVAADVREELEQRLGALSELSLSSDGGWPGAERRCLLLRRQELVAEGESRPAAALQGLVVSGNFLFDPADPNDIRQGLLAAGAAADELGDIWLRGDRGGQVVVSAVAAERLRGLNGQVRTVPVLLEAVPLEQLQWPASRAPRRLSSVEASLRLDAVVSAHFGLSRSRMVELIRSGAVRLNWQVVSSPSRELGCGDRVRLEGRGELEIVEIQATKRERWRLVMERR